MIHRTAKAYYEVPGIVFPRCYLEDDEYGRSISAHIVVCADAVIVDRKHQIFYLALRRSKPAAGCWWVIGGRRVPGETPTDGVKRKFQQETGLDIPAERFSFIREHEYIWSNRQQDPQDTPCHIRADTFFVELSETELALVALNELEYQEGGLRAFGHEDIFSNSQVTQPIRDLYDLLFPSSH